MTKIVGYHARITGLVISFVRRSSKALNKYIFWNWEPQANCFAAPNLSCSCPNTCVKPLQQVTQVYLTVFQAQAGWSQHDYGHLSVFEDNSINHLAHRFTIGTLKVSVCTRSCHHNTLNIVQHRLFNICCLIYDIMVIRKCLKGVC